MQACKHVMKSVFREVCFEQLKLVSESDNNQSRSNDDRYHQYFSSVEIFEGVA